MKKIFIILTLLVTAFISNKVEASHAAGGELTYEWLNGNTFRFTLKFYRDCSGINEPATFNMCYYNTCNTTFYSQVLNKITTLPNGDSNGTEVPTGCPNPTECTSSSSTIPGFKEWWYQGDVTLPIQCTEWTFWVSEAARNPQYNISGGNLHIRAKLNNLLAPQNNSPNFSFKPVPYICVNQAWIYNNGAFDVDGDSLSYASINPLNSTNTTLTNCSTTFPPTNIGGSGAFPAYNPVFSPIPSTGFGINPQTGIINCFPNLVSQNVITIEVTEWRNGVAIGTVLRDIQVAIVNCLIANPTASLPTSGINGLTFNINTLFYEACIADTIDFCIYITGPPDTAQITAINNIPFIFPGSTTSVVGMGGDSVLICVNWVPSALDTGLSIATVTFQDTNCLYNPIAVINSISVPIYIIPGTDGFGDTTICSGSQAPLLAVGGSSFTWTAVPGGSGIASLSCTNCSNPMATPNVTTSYIVTSNLTTQCADNVDTVTVIVPPATLVNAGPDHTMCVNGTYAMQAVVTAPAGTSLAYTWSPATSLDFPNTLNPNVINPTVTTTYTLTVVPNGVNVCAISDAITINVLNGFDILNGDTTICENASVFIATTGSNAYNYSWSPSLNVSNPNIKNPIISPDTTTTYVLTATYPGCPDSSLSITIGIELLPIINAGADRLICRDDTARLGATVLPLNPDPNFYTISWFPTAGLNNPSILDPTFSGLTTTNYTVSATTPKGCNDNDNIVVQVVTRKFLTLIPDREYCPGGSAALSTSGGTNYLWQPGLWVSDSTSNSVTAFPIATTIFTVYATNVFGCRDTAFSQIFVAPNAEIYLGPDATIFPGQSYQINSSGNCSFWKWGPNIGLDNINVSNPIAQPSVTTEYFVNAKTEFNCTVSDTIVIKVMPNSVITVPNAFTPGNGSSINDELKVLHNGIASLSYFRIFNRWGKVVFETSDINKGWNGRFNDVSQPLGTYVYQIDAIDNTGKHVVKSGNVTLLR